MVEPTLQQSLTPEEIKERGIAFVFEDALHFVKNGHKIARKGWNNPNIWVEMQVPDTHSKMTKPYLYMVKGEDKFPCDLSCESLLAEDWVIV